jgi:chaperonin GroEL
VDVNAPEKIVDMKTAGVVDPVMVTKQAIKNAVSIAATAMTMGALVVNIPEKEAPAAPTGGGMGMY